MVTIKEISFIADVTEYYSEQGTDFTQKKRVTLLVHSDQQTLILHSVQNCEED